MAVDITVVRDCGQYAEGPSGLSITVWDHGEEKYENGLHEYMNDKPEKVFEDIKIRYPGNAVIFDYSPSQFYIEFGVWIKNQEDE